MVTLYTSPSCTSCRKARAWLEEHDIPYTERNIFSEPLSAQHPRNAAARPDGDFCDSSQYLLWTDEWKALKKEGWKIQPSFSLRDAALHEAGRPRESASCPKRWPGRRPSSRQRLASGVREKLQRPQSHYRATWTNRQSRWYGSP